jgi:preprotein translocase subunit SecD
LGAFLIKSHDDLFEGLRFALKVAGNVLSVVVGHYLEILNPSLRRLGLPTIKIRSSRRGVSVMFDDGSERVDERIAKIESARQSLTEALSAMDELKERAEENKHDLEFLSKQIERAELDKAKWRAQNLERDGCA